MCSLHSRFLARGNSKIANPQQHRPLEFSDSLLGQPHQSCLESGCCLLQRHLDEAIFGINVGESHGELLIGFLIASAQSKFPLTTIEKGRIETAIQLDDFELTGTFIFHHFSETVE